MLPAAGSPTAPVRPGPGFLAGSGFPRVSVSHSMTQPTHAPAASARRHDLDALRAFAMLLGIVLHGAMAFMPFPWIVQDPQQSPVAPLIMGVIHGFRMPLFFVMSGFFTAMLWQKRGTASMLWQRFLRVFLPCLLGLLTILPAGEWVAARSREAVARQDGGKDGDRGRAAMPPLIAAIRAGDAEQVAAELAREDEAEGPNAEALDPQSQAPPLTLAALCGEPDVVRLLLDHGADPNARDLGGRTPLHAAAFLGNVEVVELLLDRGANPLAKGPAGDTPLSSSQVDWGTTAFLAGAIGLPPPDRARVEAGRARVRELLVGEGAGEADAADAAAFEPSAGQAAAGLPGWRAAYSAWLRSDAFVVPLPPRGMPQNLFLGQVFGHLWFLWFLCWLVVGFAAVAGLASRLGLPLPPRPLVVSPLALLWLVPLSLLPQLFMGLFAPGFGPDTSLGILPQPHLLAYYAIFFGYGAVLFLVGDPEHRVGRRWWLSLLLAILVCFPAGAATMTRPALAAVPQVLYAWLMSFGLIGLFRAVLPSENRVVRYVSDSAYWLYLVHIPVLVVIQTWARPWNWPPMLKLLFECAVATVVLLVSYQLFVRYTPIGWLLNGRRQRWSARPRAIAQLALVVTLPATVLGDEPPRKDLILPGEVFEVEGKVAFLFTPETGEPSPEGRPWILYAPTLPAYPDEAERWMHEAFTKAGVAVAGIDTGESYGSPAGVAAAEALHAEMVRRGYARRPAVLGRSRGGLWASAWAIAHPELTAGLGGIYPVYDWRTYPGLEKAAEAYGLEPEMLADQARVLCPIERIGVAAEAGVPVCIIHGDEDAVVPLEPNSAELKRRYEAAGKGDLVQLIIAEGQGHSFWEGFFHCQELVDFLIARAKAAAETASPSVR